MAEEGWAWLTEKDRVLEPHASSASTTDNVPPPLPGPSPAARAARKPTTPAPLPPSGSRVEQLPASQTPRAFANGTTAAAGAGRSPADMIELAQQAARATALLEAATIVFAKEQGGNSAAGLPDTIMLPSTLVPWATGGGARECEGLPLNVLMTIARHVWAEGCCRAQVVMFAQVRKAVAAAVIPGLLLLFKVKPTSKGNHTLLSGVGGGGARPEHWRELVTTGVGAGVNAVKQGLLAIQKAKGEQSDVANGHTMYTGNGNHGRLEEVEDQLAGLRKEREQLYAQIQADSLVKRFQEQKIRELESVNNCSPGGTWADTGGNGGAGVGGDDARVLELQATVTALRNKLESTEITLAEERSRHQQEQEHFARAKKVLAGEVQRLRQQLSEAAR